VPLFLIKVVFLIAFASMEDTALIDRVVEKTRATADKAEVLLISLNIFN
jgi:hypothetical protein